MNASCGTTKLPLDVPLSEQQLVKKVAGFYLILRDYISAKGDFEGPLKDLRGCLELTRVPLVVVCLDRGS